MRLSFHWRVFFLLTMLALSTRADIVKLKNGTQYDGVIQSETDDELTIEVSNASGTIFKSSTIKKAEIAEIIRPTPEQIAAREMENRYKQTLKYQLDPQYSKPQTTYDPVINNVFQAFLSKYPGSPHEPEIKERIAAWTEERDKVATGLARIGTKWVPAEEFARHSEELHARAAIDKAGTLADQGQFEEALSLLKSVNSITHRSDLVELATHYASEIGHRWITALEHQRVALAQDIKTAEDRLQRLRSERDQAEQKSKQAPAGNSDPNTYRLGGSSSAAQAKMGFIRLRDEYQAADSRLFAMKKQAADLETQLIKVRSVVTPGEAAQLAKTAVKSNTPAAATPVKPATSEYEPGTPDVLVKIADYFKEYWMVGLGAFVLLVIAGTRLFR